MDSSIRDTLSCVNDFYHGLPQWLRDFWCERYDDHRKRRTTAEDRRQNAYACNLADYAASILGDSPLKQTVRTAKAASAEAEARGDTEAAKAETAKAKAAKLGLHAFTLCQYTDPRDNETKPNGLLLMDFDGIENGESAARLKADLARLPGIVFAALSVSGRGVFGLIYAPERDFGVYAARQYADALRLYGHRFNLDEAAFEASHMRAETYDPEAYIALECVKIDDANPDLRRSYEAEKELRQRAIELPRPRRSAYGESMCEMAAKAWRASDLAEYIAQKRGEVATPRKGGAEWTVGKAKGKGSISVREIDGRAVAKDFADGAPQRDAVDWVMELEGLRDKGEAARRAAEIVGLKLPERKTASRRGSSSETAEAEENAPAETGRRRKGWKEKMRDYLSGYKFDTFAGKLHTPEGKVMDVDHLASVLWNTFDEVSRAGAYEAIDMLVRQNPARWVDSLEMKARALADCYTVADRGAIARYCERCGFDEYETARIRMWLCAAIGRAVWRGEKVDNMLVLAGEAEGTRKTDFFDAISEVLCGEGAAEVDLSAGKDTDLLLAARPVVVVDEIDKILGKVNAAQLKTRITQTTSCVRAPYDREAKTRRTAAVFGATTNVSAPIPAGEGEARRYWVIRVTREMGLEEGEAGAMLREAARDTLDALQSATGKRSARGKIWVETAEEAAETCRRNQGCKAEDAATIAIATGLRAIAENAPTAWDEVRTATAISAAIETGDGKAIGLDGLRWTPTRASAAAIRAVMKARHLRGIHKIGGRVVKGYRLRDVAAEFCPDVRPKTDPSAETFDE